MGLLKVDLQGHTAGFTSDTPKLGSLRGALDEHTASRVLVLAPSSVLPCSALYCLFLSLCSVFRSLCLIYLGLSFHRAVFLFTLCFFNSFLSLSLLSFSFSRFSSNFSFFYSILRCFTHIFIFLYV